MVSQHRYERKTITALLVDQKLEEAQKLSPGHSRRSAAEVSGISVAKIKRHVLHFICKRHG